MALYIFSDAHLGCGSPDKEAEKISKICSLVKLVELDGDRLVILGDLFDFWFEYKYVIPKAYHDVLFLLRELVKRGIKVDYVSGNHDFWMGDFFERHLGVTVHRDTLSLDYHGRRYLMIHGDGLAPADRGYRILKRVLRNRFNIWLYRKLPPDWAYPLAQWVSGNSRDYTSRRDHVFARDYEDFAKSQIEHGYNTVIIGHLHIPILTRFEKGTYVNSGDFITHFSYVRCDGSDVSLEYLK
jgi:UDP-2,3-diacylglucosamine hydrolase